MSEQSPKNILTIRQTVRRLNCEGYSLSEWALRRWIEEDEIPHRKAGKKTLLFYPNVIAYLTCSEASAENHADEPVSGIRRIG